MNSSIGSTPENKDITPVMKSPILSYLIWFLIGCLAHFGIQVFIISTKQFTLLLEIQEDNSGAFQANMVALQIFTCFSGFLGAYLLCPLNLVCLEFCILVALVTFLILSLMIIVESTIAFYGYILTCIVGCACFGIVEMVGISSANDPGLPGDSGDRIIAFLAGHPIGYLFLLFTTFLVELGTFGRLIETSGSVAALYSLTGILGVITFGLPCVFYVINYLYSMNARRYSRFTTGIKKSLIYFYESWRILRYCIDYLMILVIIQSAEAFLNSTSILYLTNPYPQFESISCSLAIVIVYTVFDFVGRTFSSAVRRMIVFTKERSRKINELSKPNKNFSVHIIHDNEEGKGIEELGDAPTIVNKEDNHVVHRGNTDVNVPFKPEEYNHRDYNGNVNKQDEDILDNKDKLIQGGRQYTDRPSREHLEYLEKKRKENEIKNKNKEDNKRMILNQIGNKEEDKKVKESKGSIDNIGKDKRNSIDKEHKEEVKERTEGINGNNKETKEGEVVKNVNPLETNRPSDFIEGNEGGNGSSSDSNGGNSEGNNIKRVNGNKGISKEDSKGGEVGNKASNGNKEEVKERTEGINGNNKETKEGDENKDKNNNIESKGGIEKDNIKFKEHKVTNEDSKDNGDIKSKEHMGSNENNTLVDMGFIDDEEYKAKWKIFKYRAVLIAIILLIIFRYFTGFCVFFQRHYPKNYSLDTLVNLQGIITVTIINVLIRGFILSYVYSNIYETSRIYYLDEINVSIYPIIGEPNYCIDARHDASIISSLVISAVVLIEMIVFIFWTYIGYKYNRLLYEAELIRDSLDTWPTDHLKSNFSKLWWWFKNVILLIFRDIRHPFDMF